jgi:hypothetical protein
MLGIYKMKDNIYIVSVDKEKPIGYLVNEYANRNWWKGFTIGTGSGICIGVTMILVVDSLFRR